MSTLFGALGTTLTTSDLLTIDPATGTATPIGPIGFAVSALVQRDADTLWGVTSAADASEVNSLIIIDKATGAGTLVGSLAVVPDDGICDIALSNSLLYALYRAAGGAEHLATVDTVTGEATDVGTFDPANGGGISDRPGDLTHFYNVFALNVFGTDGTLYLLSTVDATQTTEGDITGYPLDGGLLNKVRALATDPVDGTMIYALVQSVPSADPPEVDLVLIDAGDLAAPTAAIVGPTEDGMDALCFDSTPPTSPGIPVLESAAPSTVTVTLGWTEPDDGGSAITGYNVYRGVATGEETLLVELGAVLNYTDLDVVADTTYFYRVSAVNALGESEWSNELSAELLPAPGLAVSTAPGLDPTTFTERTRI